MDLGETLKKYEKLPAVINGKEVKISPMTEKEIKEYQIKFAKIFREKTKDYFALEIKRYENLKVLRHK